MHTELIAGRYQLLEAIATGDRSSIYRALDAITNQVVAIKIRPRVMQAFFERERVALMRFHHPNVVELIDSEANAEECSLVLEYLKGETLAARVRRGPLSLSELLSVAQQTLAALDAIHHMQFIHRDVSPENVMLISAGEGFRVKLIDFELAQVIAHSHTDEATGSVHFMAPEQFEKQPLGERTDLYALGCVLHFAATGRYPFDGESNAQVITAHLRTEAAPLTGVPAELARWIMALLRRDPQDRPASAAAALADLNSRMQRIRRGE